MNNQVVEVCRKDESDFIVNNGVPVIPCKDCDWITLKWFYTSDYETQEEVNDAAENFVNDLLSHAVPGTFFRIQNAVMAWMEGGRLVDKFKFENRVIISKTK